MLMSKNSTAVLFDMDGALIDSGLNTEPAVVDVSTTDVTLLCRKGGLCVVVAQAGSILCVRYAG